MKKFRVLFLALAAALLTSCATYQGPATTSVNTSYKEYRSERDALDSAKVIAMLSYSASHLSRSHVTSIDGIKHELFFVLDNMQTNKYVSPNYPLEPTAAELRFVRRCMARFYDYIRDNRIGAKKAKSIYPAYTAALISKINDLEYVR